MPRKKAVECWGIGFESIKDMLKDPRCKVTYSQFRYNRDVYHLSNEEAAVRRPEPSTFELGYNSYYQRRMEAQDKFVTSHGPKAELWGITGLKKICADPRCVVSYAIAATRIRRGWTVERAVTTPSRGYNKSG